MSKIVVIERCDDCPHFDNVYYGYRELCTLLQVKIEHKHVGRDFIIPDNCPLPDYKINKE